jgi:hypothetical protein
MNTLPKNHILILFLLTTSVQVITCSPNDANGLWQVIVNIFYSNPAKQPQDQLPAGITVDDYLAQWRFDLNGAYYPNKVPLIPWQDIFAIENVAKTELHNIDLRNKDYANQIIGSVMKNYVESQAKTEARKYTSDEDLINRTSSAIGNSFATRLEHTPNRDGHALHQFFGTPLAEMVRSSINNPTYQRGKYYQ